MVKKIQGPICLVKSGIISTEENILERKLKVQYGSLNISVFSSPIEAYKIFGDFAPSQIKFSTLVVASNPKLSDEIDALYEVFLYAKRILAFYPEEELELSKLPSVSHPTFNDIINLGQILDLGFDEYLVSIIGGQPKNQLPPEVLIQIHEAYANA